MVCLPERSSERTPWACCTNPLGSPCFAPRLLFAALPLDESSFFLCRVTCIGAWLAFFSRYSVTSSPMTSDGDDKGTSCRSRTPVRYAVAACSATLDFEANCSASASSAVGAIVSCCCGMSTDCPRNLASIEIDRADIISLPLVVGRSTND